MLPCLCKVLCMFKTVEIRNPVQRYKHRQITASRPWHADIIDAFRYVHTTTTQTPPLTKPGQPSASMTSTTTQASSNDNDNCHQLPGTTTQPPAPAISDCDNGVAITSGSHGLARRRRQAKLQNSTGGNSCLFDRSLFETPIQGIREIQGVVPYQL